jgi:hypothetical protein
MYRASVFYACGILAAAAGGCSSDALQPSTDARAMGTIEVSTTTTGDVPDPDGYTLAVDSKPAGTLGSNSSITFSEVSGGHELKLTGVAPNCTVEGGPSHPVTVIQRDTARVGFQISCQPTSGSVQITTETQGDTPDPDGYTANIDGTTRPERLPTTGVSTLSDISVGHHFLRLTDVAPNCSLAGPSFLGFDVTPAGTANVNLQLTCVPFGTLRAITRTTGSVSGVTGYSLTVDSELPVPIGINASLSSPRAPGIRSVTLLGVPNNCLADSPSRSAEIKSREETKVVFTIDCAPPGTGRIEVITQSEASNLIPSGYAVQVDSRNPQPIGLSASLLFTRLSSGQHTVRLTGATSRCAVLSDNPQAVLVLPGGTARVVFSILCFTFIWP